MFVLDSIPCWICSFVPLCRRCYFEATISGSVQNLRYLECMYFINCSHTVVSMVESSNPTDYTGKENWTLNRMTNGSVLYKIIKDLQLLMIINDYFLFSNLKLAFTIAKNKSYFRPTIYKGAYTIQEKVRYMLIAKNLTHIYKFCNSYSWNEYVLLIPDVFWKPSKRLNL